MLKIFGTNEKRFAKPNENITILGFTYYKRYKNENEKIIYIQVEPEHIIPATIFYYKIIIIFIKY